MNHVASFDGAFARFPLVAILRGVHPHEVFAIGEALVEAGFTIIEVPLNSPDPFASITALAKAFEGRAVVGAGTVLRAEDVRRVTDAGGTIVISPNANLAVIAETVRLGLASLPGIATPTEAFAALGAGATALKLFPAEAASPGVLKAMRAVLPKEVRMLPVGGITPADLSRWRAAGAAGFGLGSALYAAGSDATDVSVAAQRFATAYNALPA